LSKRAWTLSQDRFSSAAQYSEISANDSSGLERGRGIAPPAGRTRKRPTRKSSAEPDLSGCRPYPRQLILSRATKRKNLALPGRSLNEKLRPGFHQPTPLVEEVTAIIRSNGLVADGMRQRHFGNLARERCVSARLPSRERQSEHGRASDLHAPQH